jgi:signal transduction histidine kinase
LSDQENVKTISSLPFNKGQDIPIIRQRAQQIAIWMGLSIWDQTRIITAVSEAIWSIFRHHNEGVMDCGIAKKGDQQFLQFIVRSRAKGASEATHAVADELESVHGLVDHFRIRVDPDNGVEVTLGKSLPQEISTITPQAIREWESALAAELPSTPLEEMRRQNQELLQLLSQLQAKESALKRQLDETRRLEKAREDLIYTMIHDLRNPLTSVQTSLSGFLDRDNEKLTDYQRKMVQIAYQGTKKTVALIENILDVSRLEDNRIPLDYAPISILEIIEDVVRSQSMLAVDGGVLLEWDAEPHLPTVHGDRKIIERVLQNLVDNALKFTPPGGSIHIKAQTRADNKPAKAGSSGWLAISVQDSGPGISEELKGRLFEKFVTGSHERRGTGLGLAFCRLAVEAHGGRIGVESAPGQGARFTFTLPLMPQEERLLGKRLAVGKL